MDTKITEYIHNNSDMFRDKATDSDIKEFENKYDIFLPSSFKEWLKIFDGGDFESFQIYVVAHKPLISFDDVIRPNEDYVIIGSFSNGDPIVFKIDEEEIDIYNLEAGVIEDEERYDNFEDFLKVQLYL